MGVFTDTPRYPVIDRNPSFTRVVKNFRSDDYQQIGILAAISAPFGYIAGTARLPLMRVPSMWMATSIGALGGFCLAYQASGYRLMGFLPNDREVRETYRG